jgi:Flp pilus assembly protein TadG
MRQRRREPQSGSVSVIVAVSLVLLCGLAALTVDAGYLFSRQRLLQASADAAALAGAAWLSTSPSAATTDAIANAGVNGFTSGMVTVTTPYNTSAAKIAVTIATSYPSFFSRALGYSSFALTARGVATYDSPSARIFSTETACGGTPGIQITGSSLHVDGDIHSNSELNIFASSGDFGDASYVCSKSTSGSLTFDSGPTATAAETAPFTWATSDFPCTYNYPSGLNTSTAACWQSGTSSGGVLKPGVYCVTGNAQFNGSSISGNVTIVASGTIQFNASSATLTAFKNDVLLYSTSSASPAIQTNTSSLNMTGSLYAPNGALQMNGSGDTISGAVVAKTISMNVSSVTINSGAGGGGSSSAPYLIE